MTILNGGSNMREKIKDYIEENLKHFEFAGVEITEEDSNESFEACLTWIWNSL